MTDFSSRLASFVTGWPRASPVAPSQLARAGFVYVGSEDRVQCIRCGLIVYRWEKGDDPLKEHRRLSSLCPFLTNTRLRMHDESERIQSFANWPPWAKAKPKELAAAGFFYNGDGVIDAVQCFSCGGVARCWEDGDSALEQHQKLFPECEFVRELCADVPDYSDENIRLESFANPAWPLTCPVSPRMLAQTGFYYMGMEDNVKCFECGIFLKQWIAGDLAFGEHKRHQFNCPIVQGISTQNKPINLPITNPRLRTVASRLATFSSYKGPLSTALIFAESGYYLNGSDIVCPFCGTSWQESATPGEYHSLISPTCPYVKTYAPISLPSIDLPEKTCFRTSSAPEAIVSISGSSSPVATKDELQKQLNRLKESKNCRICMDAEVEVLFVPCGHVICCANCASMVKACPVCRVGITNMVRAYLP